MKYPIAFILYIITQLTWRSAVAQCPAPDILSASITSAETATPSGDEKIKKLEHLLAIYNKCFTRKDSSYARLMHRLGDEYRLSGNMEKGIEYTLEAISVNKNAGALAQTAYLTNSYYNLALYYGISSRFAESQSYFDSCIYYGTRFPSKNSIALMAYEQKAFNFFHRGDYQESISTAKQGISFADRTGNESFRSILIIQQAQSELALDNTPEAKKNILSAIKVLSAANTAPEYLATAYSVYASVLKKEKNYPKAIDYYRKAFSLNRNTGNWQQCSRDMTDLGYLYDHDLQNASEAMKAYRTGMQYAEKSRDTIQQTGLLSNMGFVHRRLNNYNDALSYYQKALNTLLPGFKDTAHSSNPKVEILYKIPNNYYISTLLSNKAEALLLQYKTEKDPSMLQASLETFHLADNVIDHMRHNQHFDRSKLYWRQETKSMYEKAIEACYAAANGEKAFYFFEKSRAVLLADKLSGRNYKKTTTSQPSLNEVMKELEKNKSSLVEYFNGDSVLYVLSVNRKTVHFLKINSRNYRNDASRMLALCSDPSLINNNYAEFRKLSHRLFTTVFKSLNIAPGRVIISPDDEFLPFETLIDDEDNYLVKHYSFSYAYSSGLLFRKQQHSGSSKDFLGIAPVSFDTLLKQQDLPGSDESLKRIREYFNREKIFVKEYASRKNFLDEFHQYRILQLYTHASADSSENDPLLYFHDSAIALSEIQQYKDLQAQLIMLSACQTGSGKNAKGEGVFSLGRGFYAAGIPSLVTTLWQVDNHSTYAITELFYQYLGQGMLKDDALRKAKLDYIEQNDKMHGLPYFWGSYIIMGNTDAIATAKNNNGLYYMIGIGLILLFILIKSGNFTRSKK